MSDNKNINKSEKLSFLENFDNKYPNTMFGLLTNATVALTAMAVGAMGKIFPNLITITTIILIVLSVIIFTTGTFYLDFKDNKAGAIPSSVGKRVLPVLLNMITVVFIIVICSETK